MPDTTLRHRTVTTEDGVTLPVVETGRPDGPPVVFVHGLASSSAEFAGAMSDPRLATYRLVAVDLRGHGTEHQQLEEEQITAGDPAGGRGGTPPTSAAGPPAMASRWSTPTTPATARPSTSTPTWSSSPPAAEHQQVVDHHGR